MIPLLLILVVHVVAVKVFKKSSPNGKLTVYLGKRDFVDRCNGLVDPVDGVLVIDPEYLTTRRMIYGQVDTTFRYGREEDEVMGLKFSKTMTLCKELLVPPSNTNKNKNKPLTTPIQDRIIEKLGGGGKNENSNNSHIIPFLFNLPQTAPPSVSLNPSDSEMGKPMGVEYELKAFVADEGGQGQSGHRRSTVSLRIRKVQYADIERGRKLPSSVVTKGFTFSPGLVSLEVSLDQDIYHHGEEIGVQVYVNNSSKKQVKNIKVMVVQHCEVTMVNAHFSKVVSHIESREGCPITPGTSLTKVFRLTPTAKNNRDKRGIALDGHLKDEDVNLASSTITAANMNDALGFVVSYSVRVKINCGTIGGELSADLPFKLVDPGYGGDPNLKTLKKKLTKLKSMDRANYENLCYSKDENDDEGNIIFEDFAKLRMSMSDI